MGSITTVRTLTAIDVTNQFASILEAKKNEINALLLSKKLIDKSAVLDHFAKPAVKATNDTYISKFKCGFTLKPTEMAGTYYPYQKRALTTCINRYPVTTDLPAWYFLQQTPQISLSQSSAASYLLTQVNPPDRPINTRVKLWVFYNFLTKKLHVIHNKETSALFYKELGYSNLNFVDFVQFLDPTEAAKGFYENDNELTFHGYFSTTAFLYLTNSSDPLSSNPVLTAPNREFQYHPGYNAHAFWGSDDRRRSWQYFGQALMFRVNANRKGARFYGTSYSQYPFKNDGMYFMDLSREGKTGFNFCIHSANFSETTFLENKYGLIACVETILKNKQVIPNDARILNPEQELLSEVNLGYTAGIGWPGTTLSKGVDGKFFEFEISNTFEPNTVFAANSNFQSISLPAPKLDENLRPVRRYVKITKLSHETLSGLINKKIGLQKITEIIPQSFSYPFSAIVGTKIDSRAFSQVPTRTFECKLKKILVPSNYFINNDVGIDVRYLNQKGTYQIYVGDWDGTFKLAWSNNPAWILMDLLINKRYGLGNYIESEQVDIWELYKIARWCDCVDDNGYYYGVPDSYGGVEPRHAFNALIQERFNIFDMINQIASVFRGHVYYMNSLITFDDDRLKPIIGEFSNLDVKDGLFNYTNHRKDEEFTAVDIGYMDEKDNYKPKLEYVEDSDGISKRGILKKEINAFGITSRGQARRFGYHFLYQSSKENLNITFTTDIKALLYKPGDLITVHDELMNSNKNYGVIKAIKDINTSCFEIIIDKALDKNLYDNREISIFTPIAKPKYDDISTACQFIPTEININVKNLTLLDTFNIYGGSLVGKYLHSFNLPFKPSGTIDPINCAQAFTGEALVCHYLNNQVSVNNSLQNDCYSATLFYIKDYDINNIPSKYGHWKLSFGKNVRTDSYGTLSPHIAKGVNIGTKNDLDTPSKLPFNFYFDVLQNQNIKYQLPNKLYFFEYFDTVVYEQKISSTSILRKSISIENISFQVKDYQTPKINYLDILENDRPSIETFYIKNYVTGGLNLNNNQYNEYSCLTLYKAGVTEVSNTNTYTVNAPQEDFTSTLLSTTNKEYVKDNICDLMVGSSYSLKLLNKSSKIYKIMSIAENYVNEYNVIATEFNPARFKEIEENNAIDDLNTTFNASYLHNNKIEINAAEELKAPVILSLTNSSTSLIVKWRGSPNATSYSLFVKTPSKNTRNYIAEVSSASIGSDNLFTYSWPLPNLVTEVGTYTFSIEAMNKISVSNSMYKFSQPASQTITVLSY